MPAQFATAFLTNFSMRPTATALTSRAGTGSAFKAFAGIEREKLEMLGGRRRCSLGATTRATTRAVGFAGSLLYSVVRDGATVSGSSPCEGSLVDEPTIRPTEHIFVGCESSSRSRSRTNSLNPRSD